MREVPFLLSRQNQATDEDLPQVLTIEEASKYLCIPPPSMNKLAQDANSI
jgi:hypothetical protein